MLTVKDLATIESDTEYIVILANEKCDVYVSLCADSTFTQLLHPLYPVNNQVIFPSIKTTEDNPSYNKVDNLYPQVSVANAFLKSIALDFDVEEFAPYIVKSDWKNLRFDLDYFDDKDLKHLRRISIIHNNYNF